VFFKYHLKRFEATANAFNSQFENVSTLDQRRRVFFAVIKGTRFHVFRKRLETCRHLMDY
jgi:hypothetical protein